MLSGEELTLPFAELRALIQTYSPQSTIERHGERILTSSLSPRDQIEKVTRRAAFARFGGVLLSESDNFLSLADAIDIDLSESEEKFAVDSLTMNMEECGDLGEKIKSKTRGKVSLESPDLLFQVEKTRDGFMLGLSRGYKTFDWKTRRPRARRFFLPSAIYPKLSRVLVNLSRIKEEEIFLEPFCGTGSLLIEASLMGLRTVGIDLTRWIARGAKLNMQYFSLDFESIVRADSSFANLPLREVDGVATDVPYGRASSTKGKTTEEIMNGFLFSISQGLHSNSSRKKICVVMHPSKVDIGQIIEKQGNSFQLQEQHLLYVHRNLTRAISVLRKEN